MEVSGELHSPAALPRGKSRRYPFYRGGPHSRSGSCEVREKLVPLLEIETRPFSHIAHHFTDWAILAPVYNLYRQKCDDSESSLDLFGAT
jgi:hypothetical protein